MIPVNEPVISPNARKYINDCLKTGWVSSAGKFIADFEKKFARFCKVKYATTTTSGTSALQLCLAAFGIAPGDEVIMPALTIISCPLSAIYLGAKPVLVDVEDSTGNINPDLIEEKITKKTKAIMVVHLYGHPAQMSKIMNIAKKHSLFVIEDACQAHGAEVKTSTESSKGSFKRVGSIGHISAFSFYANKIVTSGEGGMVVTNSQSLIKRAISLKDLAHSKKRRFFHQEIGFNFRMTNLQAALGLAQLENVGKYISKKRKMARIYNRGLRDISWLELPYEASWARSVFWMYAVKVKRNAPITRDRLRKALQARGIDTRTFFYPLHIQPALRKLGLFRGERYPVAEDLSKRGLYLPSGLTLTANQIKFVIESILNINRQLNK